MPLAIIIAMVVMAAAASYMSYQSQAAAAKGNEQLAENQAQAEQDAAKAEAYKLSREQQRAKAMQATLYSKAGVDLIGSPLDVMAETAAQYERDIALTGYAGGAKSASAMGEASIYKRQARDYRTMSYLGAASSGLQAYGSYAGKGGTGGGTTGNTLLTQ